MHVMGVVLAAALTGCVIPPPLNTDDPDAAVNHPPAFRSVKDTAGDELTRPGPHEFVVGVGDLRITVADTDSQDTLYVRMFVDYGVPVPSPVRAACEASPGATPTVERTITCPLLGVCTDDLADGTTHIFEVDLLDREPQSTPARLYRDVTPPGEIASYWWNITCVRSPS